MSYFYVVTSEGDDNSSGTLRNIITQVNAANDSGSVSVGFDPAVKKVTLTRGIINITSNIVITGVLGNLPSKGAPTSGNIVISGNQSSALFNIRGTNNTYFYNIALTGGAGNTSLVTISDNSNVTFIGCTIMNNHITNATVGLFIVLDSILGFGNCTLSNNTLQSPNGSNVALFGTSGTASRLGFDASIVDNNLLTGSNNTVGSIAYINGISNIIASSFTNNVVRGVTNGSLLSVSNTGQKVNISRSTFASNTMTNIVHCNTTALILFVQSSTFNNNNAPTTLNSNVAQLTNSTFANNSTAVQFNGSTRGTSAVINCTIVNNTTGIVNALLSETISLPIIGNTIVATNGQDVSGIFKSVGGNFIGSANVSNGFNNTDQVGDSSELSSNGNSGALNPQLNPLGNYGGFTQTLTPMINSPVINRGINANATNYALYMDQRGDTRVVDGTVDVGSTESQRVCLAGDSPVLVKDIRTNQMSEIAIKDVYASYHLVYSTLTHTFVPLVHNIISGLSTQFVEVKVDSLGMGIPNKTLHLTSGHVVKIGDTYMKAMDIPHSSKVKLESQKIYTLCTQSKDVVKVANMDVTTYGLNQWTDYALTKGISWVDNTEI